MIISDFSQKSNLGAAASAAARRGNPSVEWNMAKIERVGWNVFLLYLEKKHGESYLKNPEGEPLAIVDPSGIPRGYAVPCHEHERKSFKRVSPRQLPEGVYTGKAGYDLDMGLVFGEAREGSHIDLVCQALKDGPKLSSEIAEQTGLTVQQVLGVFNRRSDIFVKGEKAGKSHYWKLIGGK